MVFEETLTYGYRLRSTQYREFSFLKLCRPAYTYQNFSIVALNNIMTFYYFTTDCNVPSTRKKVISVEGEKNGIPAEVALIYNNSYAVIRTSMKKH